MEQSINQILLFALAQPDYARPEYFREKQQEFGYSKEVFSKMLEDACKFFYDEIHKNDYRDINGVVSGKRLSLFDYSKCQINDGRHFGEKELGFLLLDIEAAFPVKVPTNRELLTQAHIENGGLLTTDQIKALAKKYPVNVDGKPRSAKHLSNMYMEIKEDLKK